MASLDGHGPRQYIPFNDTAQAFKNSKIGVEADCENMLINLKGVMHERDRRRGFVFNDGVSKVV